MLPQGRQHRAVLVALKNGQALALIRLKRCAPDANPALDDPHLRTGPVRRMPGMPSMDLCSCMLA